MKGGLCTVPGPFHLTSKIHFNKPLPGCMLAGGNGGGPGGGPPAPPWGPGAPAFGGMAIDGGIVGGMDPGGGTGGKAPGGGIPA